jgi:ribosomal-protein-alanine N-acetyltransferase
MRHYFMKSSRLGFSLWNPADLPHASVIWEDPDVMRLHGGPYSPVETMQRLSLEIENCKTYGVQYWPVFLTITGEFIGCCGLKPRDVSQGIWEFGCQIRRTYWSHGLGREATTLLIDYSFHSLGVQAIRAGHHPSNEASQRLITSLGFQRIPDEVYPATGLMEPCYMLTRSDKST